jgi:hypothetical protein
MADLSLQSVRWTTTMFAQTASQVAVSVVRARFTGFAELVGEDAQSSKNHSQPTRRVFLVN